MAANMGNGYGMEARAVCTRLMALAGQGGQHGTVHSVFHHAVNVELAGRLISLVMEPGSLVPYGCTVGQDQPFPLLGIQPGDGVKLEPTRLTFSKGPILWLSHTAPTELSVDAIPITSFGTENEPKQHKVTSSLQTRLRPILDLLQAGEEGLGLSVLVTGGASNVYATFIAPRLKALFAAVGATDGQAVALAGQSAGCGIGLTPSSDDLLIGYFLTVRLLSRANRMQDVRALLPRMAAAAAEKTNRISGAFLINSGDGLASVHMLTLLEAIFTGAPAQQVRIAAERVAAFGSTSGRDTLTGVVLAIQHHDGGKNSGQTGNQKERLL